MSKARKSPRLLDSMFVSFFNTYSIEGGVSLRLRSLIWRFRTFYRLLAFGPFLSYIQFSLLFRILGRLFLHSTHQLERVYQRSVPFPLLFWVLRVSFLS